MTRSLSTMPTGAGLPKWRRLAPLCRAEIIGPCAALSLLGRNIRGILHDLGAALELFIIHHDGTGLRQLTSFGGSSVCTPTSTAVMK